MMNQSDRGTPDVRAMTLETARELESMQFDIDAIDGFICDVLDVIADTRGEVTLVLGTGGPHVELRLGLCEPELHISWAGQHASSPVNLSSETLEALDLGALWHAAIANSLANPPHEG